MFDRQDKPDQPNTFATGAALLLLAGVLSAPALAATSARITCPDAAEATLDVPVHALATELVNNNVPAAAAPETDEIAVIEIASSNSLLAPRAAAAIRNAFKVSDTEPMAGTDSKPVPESDDDQSAEADSGMNTKLPGISDDDFLRYKKQMYRRDI